jgi:hypothetical protein
VATAVARREAGRTAPVVGTSALVLEALPSYLPEPEALREARARARRRAATYRRRRLVVAAVALLLCAGATVGLHRLTALAVASGADPATGTRGAVPEQNASAQGAVTTVVVASGDTMWSLARRIQPRGDVRPLVDELVRLNGGASLEVGQMILVPSMG